MKNSYKMLAAGALALSALKLWERLHETDIRDQVVLITGGSRGLGLALAQEFARHGCRIAICARKQDELGRALQLIKQITPHVHTVVCDITVVDQVSNMVQEVTEHFGRIDILVNSAGIISVGPAQALTLSHYQEAMDSDFWGGVNCTLAVLPQMQARRAGSIVNVTSIGGKIAVPHLLPYSCAKFASTAFSDGLRAELAQDGVTVTTIVPGLLRTGSYDQAKFTGQQEKEYAWFSAADNLPGLSISAERAAREIVAATRRKEAQRVLSLPAKIAVRLHGMAPVVTSALLTLVSKALPVSKSSATLKGRTVHANHPSPLLDQLTVLGHKAQKRLNQQDA